MLNTKLNSNALAQSFKIDNRLQIRNFMQREIAERMHSACKTKVPFSTHYVLDGKYQSKTPTEMAHMKPQQAIDTNNEISAAASRGIGFLYEGYLKSKISSLAQVNTSDELNFLHTVFDYLSSETVLQLIRQITGSTDISRAEPQYTRYTSGHFLTRHLDVVSDQQRRYAFVLGLTKGWHPDWGGLLQFYEKDGTPREAWMPQFNVLSIFDVSHIHSVTYVTPYAIEPRLSLTGWFVA